MGEPLRIRCTGVCSVGTLDGRWERSIATAQGRLVLARLALAQRPVARDELAEMLWPGETPGSWERHLSAIVSKLRRLLADGSKDAHASIVGGAGTYELRLPPGSVVDVASAEAGVESALAALAENRMDEALTLATEAAETLRRPFLPGTDALWADKKRDELRDVMLRALDVAVEVAIRRRDAGRAAVGAEAIALDPYREAGYRNLMRLHLATGELAAAAQVYEKCRSMLSGELGIDPSPDLERLSQLLREGEADRGPPIEVAAPGRSLPGVLLAPATSFVGRASDLGEVAAALRRSRLVTLTGTGGVGKSRLAVEAARPLAEQQRDGARGCELAAVLDPHGVVHALAAMLGVRQSAGSTIEDTLVNALSSQDLLLVLDNCEHVLDALAPLIERILGQCPRIHILATSRERLGARGEVVLEVRPLAVPDPDADPDAEWNRPAPALELLRDRISSLRADYQPMGHERTALMEICRRLDGLPLAIELAAARVAGMGAVEVASRLDERFKMLTHGWRTALPRHRTLRAAVEWSYDLLDDAQRKVFECASVFVDGFTLDAAEQVCHEAGIAADVADVVATLAERSMLIIDGRSLPSRYRMLETLRQFGHDGLAERGALAHVEEAHARRFVAFAQHAEAMLRGPAEAEWVAILDAELGNIRAAHAWAMRSGNLDLAVELSAALFHYAHWRSHSEILARAEELAVRASGSGAHLARALASAGDGAWRRGDLSGARSVAERAVAAVERAEDARFGWHILGAVALFEGRLEDAIDALDRAATLARSDGDHYHATDMLGTKACTLSYAGDAAAAAGAAQESRAEAALCASPSALAWSSYASGEVLASIDPERALGYLDRAVELAEPVGAHFIRGVALLTATSLRARTGDPVSAAEDMVRIIDLWERAGNWRQQWVTLRSAVDLLVRLGRDEAAAVVLGAIDARDADNVYGEDAERLLVLRTGLEVRLGATAHLSVAKGKGMDPADVVAFTRRQLGEEVEGTARAHPRP